MVLGRKGTGLPRGKGLQGGQRSHVSRKEATLSFLREEQGRIQGWGSTMGRAQPGYSQGTKDIPKLMVIPLGVSLIVA